MLCSPEDFRLGWLNDLFHSGGEWVTAGGQDWGHWLESYKQSHNFGWGKVNLDFRQSQCFLSDERKSSHFSRVNANTGHDHPSGWLGFVMFLSLVCITDCPCVVRVKLLMSGTCLEKQDYFSGNRTLSYRGGRHLWWSGSFCPEKLSCGRIVVMTYSTWRPVGWGFLSLALCSITLSLKETLRVHRNLCMLFILHGSSVAPLSVKLIVFLHWLGMLLSWWVLVKPARGHEFNPQHHINLGVLA